MQMERKPRRLLEGILIVLEKVRLPEPARKAIWMSVCVSHVRMGLSFSFSNCRAL